MSLLIPIPRVNLEALQKALRKVAGFDWDSRGSLHVFALDQRPQGGFAEAICDYCRSHKVVYVLVPRRVHCDEKALTQAGYSVLMGPSIAELTKGRGLE